MKIGLQYNKPKQVFQSIAEHPWHPDMIYCIDEEHAQLILNQFKKMAMDAIEKQYHSAHLKIKRLAEEINNDNS